MANSTLLISLSLCLLVIFHVSLAQFDEDLLWGSLGRQLLQHRPVQRRLREETECRIENLDALEPTHRVESDAGLIEFWDQDNDQLQCAGVAFARYTIRPRGLLLPSYTSAPKLIYIVQGIGYQQNLLPGCPETFQSYPQEGQGEQGYQFRDQHQRIQRFQRGDILVVPNGIAHWIYNDGENEVVLVALYDSTNDLNQLEDRNRRFLLAGNPQRRQQGSQGAQGSQGERGSQGLSYEGEEREAEVSGISLFNGFDTQWLTEVLGVDEETARKLQGQDDNRGTIVTVEHGLQVIIPPRREEEEQRERQGRAGNGFEETLCNVRVRENIDDPERADVYNPHAGRVTSLNSEKLPILNYLQLSAQRGVLYSNAIHAPHWHNNAHSVIYVTRGSARVQIVGNRGRRVYDGNLSEGQLLVVPQGFVVLKQASNEGFEWVSFKTNDDATTNPLAGRNSVFRALPEEVLMNAYQIRREEARRIKYGREETEVLSSRPGGQGQGQQGQEQGQGQGQGQEQGQGQGQGQEQDQGQVAKAK